MEEKKISLNDLREEKKEPVKSNYEEVTDFSDFLPKQSPEKNEMAEKIVTQLNNKVESVKNIIQTAAEINKNEENEEIDDVISESGYEEVITEEIPDDIDRDIHTEDTNIKEEVKVEEPMVKEEAKVEESMVKEEAKVEDPMVKEDESSGSLSDLLNEIDDDDDDLLDENKQDEEEAQKQLEQIKTKLKTKLKPVTNVIDLKSFTISNKPVSVTNALIKENTNNNVIDWVLFSAEKVISMKEVKGYDIEKMVIKKNQRSLLNQYKQRFQTIYDHIVDPNKPMTLEAWIKSFGYFDMEHLFFAIYRSAFMEANYIPVLCPHCKELFVSENIDLDKMVKFTGNEIKEKFEKILKSNDKIGKEYEIELIQVSDEYVFGFKEPSVYSVLFENLLLDEKFVEKYNDLLSLMTYIDQVYRINRETQSLDPVMFKEYPNSDVKTIKSRIKGLAAIINTLNSDQLFQVNSYRNTIAEINNEVTYVIPEMKCPKCKKVIPEEETLAEQLLFTRHQLGSLATM